MDKLRTLAENSSKTISFMLGGLVILLALGVFATSLAPQEIAQWTFDVFGYSFLGLYLALVFAVVFSWISMQQKPMEKTFWLEAGLQAANGVSTLALTYTLLGISLGIGTLGDQELTPATVQLVIKELTQHFSLAFLTTVVGLPSAAFLRALMVLTYEKNKGGIGL